MADSLVIDTGRKEASWVSYIKSRILKKKNFLGVITGPPGIGKSWTGLSICNQVDPNFSSDKIITKTKQLLEFINSGKLKAGDAILWDEAGIDISNRNWQNIINKTLNFLFQTFRHKRIIVIMTVPFMDFIDAGTRKLIHSEFIVQNINFDTCKTKVKPMLVQYNARNRKFYYKFLRKRSRLGRVGPIKAWHIEKPPTWLIEAYEEIKAEFTSNLNKELQEDLEEDELKRSRRENRKSLTQKQEDALVSVAKYGSVQLASQAEGTSERTLFFHIAQAKKKGYTIDDFKEGESNGE